jgi:cyclopropane-fatty-acyl-phospholipid synthase
MLTRLNLPAIEKWLLQRMHQVAGRAPVRIVLEDGGEISPSGALPVATVVIHDRKTLARLVLNPEIGFGDGYRDGRIEVEGDLVALLEAVNYSLAGNRLDSWYSRLASRWLKRTQANTLRLPQEHPSSLRSQDGFLQALARFAVGLLRKSVKKC